MLNRCHIGDCRDSMRALLAAGVRVQTCVTSPPYWGLRDYGHDGQLGLETTPEEYVANMVEVFRLVRELLSDDGVLWLNIGDSYNAYNGNRGASAGFSDGTNGRGHPQHARGLMCPELKPKDLVGIPWMLAFALRADGWCLRQDIIWHKPNPMPESVRDRCTKAHEHLFLLTKVARYFWDAEAMKEPATGAKPGNTRPTKAALTGDKKHRTSANLHAIGAVERRNRRSVWTVPTQPYAGAHFAVFPPALIEPCILTTSRPGDVVLDPFFGSGTTGEVAQRLGRQWVGCELNPEYGALQEQRTAQTGLML